MADDRDRSLRERLDAIEDRLDAILADLDLDALTAEEREALWEGVERFEQGAPMMREGLELLGGEDELPDPLRSWGHEQLDDLEARLEVVEDAG